MTPPKLTALRQDDTHRLIPSRYSEESVLGRLAEDNRDLQALFELEGATNDRLLGEANLLPGISVHELLFGVSYAHIVNAAFTHAHPSGSRFNSPGRGAWYAAFELKTAQAETAFHKAQELAEIGWHTPEVFSFKDYLADFRAEFHDIRGDAAYAGCLDPASYANSQSLAWELLAAGSAGIVYPSVRRAGGNCVACFRPALVANVRQGRTVMIAFRDPKTPPVVNVLREVGRD
ncbi:MAG TPA: RES family NAD+ phosphorylase [Terriglobia bacterium]|nr:RES family NAD+ phosphorylase [Terriglobia bacterium]